jgi:putative transcriptional regulator
MKTVRVKIDPAIAATMALGRVDTARVDATTQEDIVLQEAADEAESMQDAAKFARGSQSRMKPANSRTNP